jgi:hypothetical protein
MLKKWIGTARWIYNQCLATVKNDPTTLKKKYLRDRIVNNDNYHVVNTWVTEVPYEVRDAAMVELLEAYRSNFAKKKEGSSAQI